MDTPMPGQGDDQMAAGATPGPATPPPADDNAGGMTPPPPPPMDAPQDAPAAPPPPPMPDMADAPAPAPEMPAEPTVGGVAADAGPDSVEKMPDTDAAPADDATTPAA